VTRLGTVLSERPNVPAVLGSCPASAASDRYVFVTRFMMPVRGLSVDFAMQVGPVALLPEQTARTLAKNKAAGDLHPLLAERLGEFAESLENAVASVEAPDKDVAMVLVEDALAVVRAWVGSTAQTKTTTFGLRDGNWFGVVEFVDLDSGGAGWTRYGHPVGMGLPRERIEAFNASVYAQFVAPAIGIERPPEGQRRALLACRLMSQASLMHDPGVGVVLSMTAAEGLLIEPNVLGKGRPPKARSLAQRASFLLCGVQQQDLCGRSRETCPYLGLSPDSAEYSDLVKRAEAEERWFCSEWFRFYDWFALRSEIVHEGAPCDEKEASRLSYWMVRWLLPEALTWFTEHPEDPVGDLKSAIKGLPTMPDWEMACLPFSGEGSL
jgi:hypothetical protein